MAFNDNPYIKVKLNSSDPNDEGYSKIKVNNNTVWKKPLNYTKTLYIMDYEGHIQSYDAVRDFGLGFSLQRKRTVNNSTVLQDVLSPAQNNTSGNNAIVLNNQDVIKYEDSLIYSYTLSTGYILYGTDQSKMHTPNGDINLSSNTEFIATNDFDIFIRIKPIKYTLTVTTDSHITGYTIRDDRGRIASIQGEPLVRPVGDGDTLYYGDYLRGIAYLKHPGYLSEIKVNGSTFNDTQIFVDGDITIDMSTTPMETPLRITTSQYGVSSVQVYRVAGAVAIEQGESDGYVINNDTLYYGDVLQVTTVEETGYEIAPISDITVTEAMLTQGLTINVVATPKTHTFSIRAYGKTIIDGDTTSDVRIDYTPGTISTRLGRSRNTLYNSTLYDGVNAYSQDYLCYGDTITLTYDCINSCYSDPSQVTLTVPNNDFYSDVTIYVYWGTMTWDPDIGIDTLTVTRTSSPNEDAPLGTLDWEQGDTVYYGDELEIVATAKAGYDLDDYISEMTILENDYGWSNLVSITSYPITYYFSLLDTTGISNVKLTLKQKGVNPDRVVNTVLYNGSPLALDLNYTDIYYGEKVELKIDSLTGYSDCPTRSLNITGDTQIDPGISVPYTPISISVTGNASRITGIVITCVDPSIGDEHTADEQLYSGTIDDLNTYSRVSLCYNEVINIEWTTLEPYEDLPDTEWTLISTNVISVTTPETKSYILNYSSDTGIDNIRCERIYRRYPAESTQSVLRRDGDSYNYGDDIRCRIYLKIGYDIDNPSYYDDRQYQSSAYNYTITYYNVQEKLTLTPTSHLMRGTISLTKGSNVNSYTVTATRDGNSITLQNGDTLYYGDVITVSNVSVAVGYEADAYTETQTFAPTADGRLLSINITASVIACKLYTNSGTTGVASTTITRTASPIGGGSIGTVTDGPNGDNFYVGDSLTIDYTFTSDYVYGLNPTGAYQTSRTETFTLSSSDIVVDGDPNFYSDFEPYGKYFSTYINNFTIKLCSLNIYQCTGKTTNVSNILNEDLITLKVVYGYDNLTVDYDPSIKIKTNTDANAKVRIYRNRQTYNPNLPTISSVYVRRRVTGTYLWTSLSPKGLSSNQYYEIIGGSHSTYDFIEVYIFFSIKSFNVTFKINSDDCKYLYPDVTTVNTEIVSSPYYNAYYGTGNTVTTRSFSLEDYNYPGQSGNPTTYTFTCYYRDRLKTTFGDITGWNIGPMEVYADQSLLYNKLNGDYFDVGIDSNSTTSYTVQLDRSLKPLTLQFTNTYAKFTDITIGDTQMLTEDWVSLNGTDRKAFACSYGERFKKHAEEPDYNSPMILSESTHNNDTWYYASSGTAIKHIYDNKLLPLTNFNIQYAINNNYLDLYISAYNPNNMELYSSADTPYQVRLELDNSYSGYDFIDSNIPTGSIFSVNYYSSGRIPIGSNSMWSTRHTTITIKINIEDTVVTGMFRSQSDIKTITISIDGNNISHTIS